MRLIASQFLISAFILFAPLSAFAQSSAKLVVPVEGNTKFKQEVTERIAQKIRERIRLSKTSGLDVSKSGTASMKVVFDTPLTGLNKTLLTSAGHFAIREVKANSELFDIALSEFSNLNSRKDGGVRSICSDSRADLDHALKRMVGPDVHFAVYRNRSISQWCALSLGNLALKNDAVERITYRKALEGQRSMSIKIKADYAARLAENGELDVKTLGITLDGDLIARSTLAQIRRIPISIRPPAHVSNDADRKRWLALVHALIMARIPMPIVLLED